jgi:hypothetical protein
LTSSGLICIRLAISRVLVFKTSNILASPIFLKIAHPTPDCGKAAPRVLQHNLRQRLSFNSQNDDFKEFVDTLVVALRLIEKAESPIRHIHPVAVRESVLSGEGCRDFGLGFPVNENSALDDGDLVELSVPPVLKEVGDRG